MAFVGWSVHKGELREGIPIMAMSQAMMALDEKTPGITLDQLPSPVCLHCPPKQSGSVQVRVDGQDEDLAFDENGIVWLPTRSRVFVRFQEGAPRTMAITANGTVRVAEGIDTEVSFLPIIPPGTPPLQANAMVWLDEGEVGSSSLLMCRTMAGVGPEYRGNARHPSDTSDLGRCLGFLAAVPQAREHLDRMQGLSPAWDGLVARWSELEEAMGREDGRPRATEIMQEILDPLEPRRSFGPR